MTSTQIPARLLPLRKRSRRGPTRAAAGFRLHAGRSSHSFDSNGEPDADSQEQRSFLARAFGTITAVVGDFTKSPELIGDHDMTKGYLTCIRDGIESGTLAAGKKLPADW
jgi:hypothetical protein